MEFINNLKFAWKYTKDQKKTLIFYIIANLLSTVISVILPILSAKIIIALTSSKFIQLLFIALVIFIVQNINNIINYAGQNATQLIYRESFNKIQVELGREILKLENACIDKNGSGLFMQRMNSDAIRLADIFNVLNYSLGNIITVIGIFIAIFTISKSMFFYQAIIILILYLVNKQKNKIYSENDKAFRDQNENVSGFTSEIIRGVRDIKMLNSENDFINELENKIQKTNKMRYKTYRTDNKFCLLEGFIMDASDLISIIILVILITKYSLPITSALIIYNYLGRTNSLSYFVNYLMRSIKDFNLSASRVFKIIKGEEFKKEEFGNVHIDKINGDFEFNKVYFKYNENENYVLKNLNFKVKANETVAFVGKSGAGKTTIFNLLCKMYSPEKGSITIDGIDIQKLDKDSIRGNITIISQNPYIFNMSIRDNFRLVKNDLTDREMKKACKTACLDDFIKELPNGYDTIVGEGGVNLSGGQKQRLAIARALIQKTEIILFDEATSALDNETQSKIQKAIDNMKEEYTIMIIAHRLSTVINADRILFLENGKIACEGTHKELLKKCKGYRELYETEIAKEEN